MCPGEGIACENQPGTAELQGKGLSGAGPPVLDFLGRDPVTLGLEWFVRMAKARVKNFK